jgi:flagellar biosynthesis/type III secretory pathway protein FliH
MAALAIAVIVAFGGLSLAQYRDNGDGYNRGNPRQAHQYGYQQGYREGFAKGRHEGRENDPNDYQSPDRRQATRGYEQWMGPVQAFREGYRDGYGIGFRAGYESLNRGWDDDIYDQSSYGYDGSIGYRTGYQDGISQAREDANKNKPFNPNPRGKL